MELVGAGRCLPTTEEGRPGRCRDGGRTVLAEVAKDYPKSCLDKVEMIQVLKIVKDSAIKAHTRAIDQTKAIITTHL